MMNQIRRWSRKQCRKQMADIIAGYTFTALYAAITLVYPILLSELVKRAISGHQKNNGYIGMCVLVLIMGTVMLFVSNLISQNAENKFTYSLKHYIWTNNLHGDYLEYRKRNVENDFQIITMESGEIGRYYFHVQPNLFLSVVLAVGTLAWMCFGWNQIKTGMVLATVVPCSVILILLVQKMEGIEQEYIKSRSQYFSFLVKIMNEVRTLKLFVLYQNVTEKLDTIGKNVIKKYLKQERNEIAQKSLLQLLQYILIIYGVYAYVKKGMQLEQFFLYEQYAILFVTQVSRAVSLLNERKKKCVVEKKLEEILLPVEVWGEQQLENINEIAVNDVTFSFDETKELYRNFSCRFEKGKCYLIKAANGFGKSTLFDLLTGIEKPIAGDITYNGIPMEKLNMGKIRREQLCFLTQNSFFLGESLGENIEHYFDDITEAELKPYLEKLHMVVNQSGDFNHIFSGGEKKKIAFALLMKKVQLTENAVILLDEPTNMLDQQTKEDVVSYIKEVKQKAVTLIISHDCLFDSVADEVMVLDRQEDYNG